MSLNTALPPKLVGVTGLYKFGISTAPAYLNADSAGVEFNNEEHPLMDSANNVIALGITRNREKTIKYDGVIKSTDFPEPGNIITVTDPQSGENVTGVVGADVSYSEGRTEWAKVSFSLHFYPCLDTSKISGYRGGYNPETNTPNLSNGMSGVISGDTYYVIADGTRDFGDGDVVLVTGDLIKYDGAVWSKV